MTAAGALLVGFLSGALSGAVGVGGAVVSTPGIRALGVPPIVAVGTTLPAILPSAATGSLNYARARLIDYRVAAIIAVAGGFASVGGAITSDYVGGRILMFITAALVGENSIRMARDARRLRRAAEEDSAAVASESADEQSISLATPPPVWLVAVIGLLAGFISGLLGVGGGVVMVPAFYRILKMPVKQTVATSLLVVGILAIPGSVVHSYLGHIDFRIAGLLALGVVPGAFVGSRFTVRTDEIRLRIVVATVLAVIALGYIAGEIRSILAG
ncbi:MAG: hypothetical protein DCC49_00645 [Acidobacteria bacterium]|nr:MAG: hypothetical protein DCC49_00645 [Acidobacteriota bacterium]